MTNTEQRRFVEELIDAVGREVVAFIRATEPPEDWDGHELRCLVADSFARAAAHTRIRQEPRGKRAQEFKNFCITH